MVIDIIQQIRAMPIYSQQARYLSSVHNRYPVIYVGCQVFTEAYIFLPKHTFSRSKMDFFDSLLNNKHWSRSILRNIVLFKPTRPTASSAKYQAIFRSISQK